jgi:predicted PurR-regulated permease PerM
MIRATEHRDCDSKEPELGRIHIVSGMTGFWKLTDNREENGMAKINWPRTRDILICIICIGIIVYFAWGLLFGEFVHALVLLLLSLAVAFLLTPFVNFLSSFIPRILATLIAYIIVLAVIGGISYALVFTLIQQVVTFQDTVVNFFNHLPSLNDLQKFLVQNGIPQSSITDAVNQIKAQAVGFATALASNALNIVFIVTSTFIDVVIIIVMSFYFTLDGKHIRESLMSIVPEGSKHHVHLFEDALNHVVGNYIRGQLTLAVIIGILAGVGCAFLGLSGYALIIGVLAFLFETIPMVGPALASIPAILISLLLPDPFPRTFWIVAYFIGIQIVESNVLGPRIVGHAVGLHPIASLLALIIGAQLFGAFGALLATPLVAAAWVVIASVYRSVILGQTADQMLAKSRRKPWITRSSSGTRIIRAKRTRTTPSGKLRVDLTNVEQRESIQVDAAPPHFMSTNVNVDHIDLLRPVPDGEEQIEEDNDNSST